MRQLPQPLAQVRVEPRTDAEVLRQVRDARFNRGLWCVRCGSSKVQRWGTFSNRQRYRCRACRRTFSDLTATPAVYSKKLSLWPSYAGCFEFALSVRASAAAVGLHPCTAFRWRHAIAAWLRDADRTRLRGRVELRTTWFATSRKGERGVPNPRRHAAPARYKYHGPQGWIFFACDREAHVASVVRTSRVGDEWDLVLRDRLEKPCVLMSFEAFDGRPSEFAGRIGVLFENPRWSSIEPPRGLAHLDTVTAYIRRFSVWLARFRGVATKYLPNYLDWHRRSDGSFRYALARSALRWPIGV